MNPKQSLERAAYAFLTNPDIVTPLTLVASTSIYKGISNPTNVEDDENTTEVTQKAHPSVTLEAEGSHEEAVAFTNLYQGVLAVTVEAISETTTDTQFHAICQEVFAKFNIQEIEANMTAAARAAGMAFTVLGRSFRIAALGSAVNNGHNWQMTHRYNCVYAEANL
jgi:hypothetical protein